MPRPSDFGTLPSVSLVKKAPTSAQHRETPRDAALLSVSRTCTSTQQVGLHGGALCTQRSQRLRLKSHRRPGDCFRVRGRFPVPAPGHSISLHLHQHSVSSSVRICDTPLQ
ncbi:hypothetical protein NDU88_004127 [Pleurodeles waltl]|uniref:Uncharacterized protein n=1 Tax=Pleurodeles waltl TaxID=8319 RepID=A0AAV7M6Z3_PLEWA|nr:hypothetical protein NDU88_004127 [Pleurodeles waltl]